MLTRGHQKMVIFWHGRYRSTPELRGVVCPILLWSVLFTGSGREGLSGENCCEESPGRSGCPG
jgi:hypothetical protein